MKRNETLAPEAEISVDEPVKDALQIGVKITGANGVPDRFIPCESRVEAELLLGRVLEARSAFQTLYQGCLVGLQHIAYAEVVEQ